MSWGDDAFYTPEKVGLVKIAEHELEYLDYSYDLLVAWRNERGIYLATDTGCSCPTPFENYGSIDEFTGPLTVEQALEEAANIKRAHHYPLYDPEGFNAFIAAIREAC